MTFETAVASRPAPTPTSPKVVEALCHLAMLSHALGHVERRDDTVDAAAELLRAQPAASMRPARVF